MYQLRQRCMFADHNSDPVDYFCTYAVCQQSRYMCRKCYLEDLHIHKQANIKHIITLHDFKILIDSKVMNLKKIVGLYNDIEERFKVLYLNFDQQQQEIYFQLKKQQEILTNLVKKTDFTNKTVYMIPEELIQEYTIILSGIIEESNLFFYQFMNEFYQKIQQTIQEISAKLVVINNEAQKLEIEKIRRSRYQRILVNDFKVPFHTYKLSREENYLVVADYESKIFLVDLNLNIIISDYRENDQITAMILIESANTLILGNSAGSILIYDLINNMKVINKKSQWGLRNKQILQIFDLNKNTQFLVFCQSGNILIVDTLNFYVVKEFAIGYQEFSAMDFNYNRQIIAYSIKGVLSLWKMESFILLSKISHSYERNNQYSSMFSMAGNYLALISIEALRLDIYSVNQKQELKLQLFLIHQIHNQMCINLKWIMNDNYIVMQMNDNTKVVNAKTFEIEKIIETNTDSNEQCFEQKKLSYIISIEKGCIVRHDI